MELRFLGTGAADWNIGKAEGNPDFRRFSSLLVDRRLLVDPGPHIFQFAESFGLDGLYDGVTDIICTHLHGDHYNENTRTALCERGAVFHEIPAGETLDLPHYCITAYPGNHSVPCTHLVIESKEDGHRFFYGCDGAWLPYETALALRNLGHLDLMIFDCTIGDIDGDYRIFEHNNVAMVSEMRKTFLKLGTASRFMVTHLARTLHPGRTETETLFSSLGFETAYDNMVTTV